MKTDFHVILIKEMFTKQKLIVVFLLCFISSQAQDTTRKYIAQYDDRGELLKFHAEKNYKYDGICYHRNTIKPSMHSIYLFKQGEGYWGMFFFGKKRYFIFEEKNNMVDGHIILANKRGTIDIIAIYKEQQLLQILYSRNERVLKKYLNQYGELPPMILRAHSKTEQQFIPPEW